MQKNVLITGGTGFVGRNLTKLLVERGFTVSILSRDKKEHTDTIFYYTWDVAKQKIEEKAVLDADYIIHLAGENIAAQRWTTARKEAIISSREQSITLIHSVLKKYNKIPDAFISASGVGIYQNTNGQIACTEMAAQADDFLGNTCNKWEAAADRVGSLGIRTVKIRTGLVLGRGDGILNRLIPIFKLKLGSIIGSGKQYMPWIHIYDLCQIYLHAIQNKDLEGAYNAAIDDQTTNAIFSKLLAKQYGYSLWLPAVPAFVLKLMMGEMASIVLTGNRISSKKIEDSSFSFVHRELEAALKDCLAN